jgi:two-component system CheB/CheR fusion protein
VHPEEFGHLNAILINVTSFFRDEQAWEFLRERIIPDILAKKGGDDTIRVWSAGCASGEEAYSLAILFAEALGPEKFKQRVKIYATDISDAALGRARQATYSEREMEVVGPELRKKYFTQHGGNFVFDADLRRAVVFGRHDLINDSPISRVDLLLCRNTLMYFNSETQGRILQRFHFALADDGYLMLGKAEMLLSNGDLFTPVDLKRRIARKIQRAGNDRAWFLAPAVQGGPAGQAPPQQPADPARPTAPEHRAQESDLKDAAIRSAPMAFVLVDADGMLVMANEHARTLFGLSADDIGRRFSELSICYRPVELRPYIQQAVASGAAVTLQEVEWQVPPGAVPMSSEVTVAPLLGRDGSPLGVSVSYADISQFRKLEGELRESNQALETAQEELQTTNEELQSTVEELETTNEELQSTNEELETMNEELQSTNEELRTSNDELRQRSDQLDHIESFWGSVIRGLPAGMIVLDADLRVQVWNTKAEDLWGLRPDEVRGRHFMNLDFGLSTDQLRGPLREAQAGRTPEPLVLDAVNRRGRSIRCRVELTPMGGKAPHGVLVLMQETGDIAAR